MCASSSTPASVERLHTAATPLTPDRDLLRRIGSSGGEDLRQCMQCATCSGVCELAAEHAPVPRKEMLWAQWGMRDQLMADVDIWLCHECHDCTERCPRGARPGDVMAALRRECVAHFSTPRFLARAALRPINLVLFFVFSSALLFGAYLIWDQPSVTASTSSAVEPRIVIGFCTAFPHELLLTLFGSVVLFDCLVLSVSLTRFWHALRAALCRTPTETRAASISASVAAVVKRIAWHQDFARCTNQGPRRISHSLVIYSMLALVLVDIWVITARYNPLRVGLVYPLGLRDPWKVMANVAGTMLIIGCTVMCRDRIRRGGETNARQRPTGTYFDWQLLVLLLGVAITGFLTQVLHFMRLDAERVWAYCMHLVTVLTFLLLLPYSKLAHAGFRSVALVFAEHYAQRRPAARSSNQGGATS